MVVDYTKMEIQSSRATIHLITHQIKIVSSPIPFLTMAMVFSLRGDVDIHQ